MPRGFSYISRPITEANANRCSSDSLHSEVPGTSSRRRVLFPAKVKLLFVLQKFVITPHLPSEEIVGGIHPVYIEAGKVVASIPLIYIIPVKVYSVKRATGGNTQ